MSKLDNFFKEDIDMEVGEVRENRGVKVKAIASDDGCDNCIFFNHCHEDGESYQSDNEGIIAASFGECGFWMRSDETAIIFKEVK